MRLANHRFHTFEVFATLKYPWFRRLVSYAIVVLFFALGDAVMSYFSPVYIQSHVQSQSLMGIIIAASSMVGFVCDILFGEWFAGRRFPFFLKRAVVICILFALSFVLFPSQPIFFLIAMAFWGIGYEFILFSDFHFIDEALEHPHHSMGWSIVKTFSGLAYMVGPLIASFLMATSLSLTPVIAAILYGSGLLLFSLLRSHLTRTSPVTLPPDTKKSLKHEFALWYVLIPVLWPVLTFILILTILDATFWTIGTVLAETLKTIHPFGGFLLVAYMFPALFAGFLGAALSSPLGKKRTAFIAGIVTGVCFMLSGSIHQVTLYIFIIFIASVFMGIAIPLIYAAIEDYIERLGHSSNALVGLENSVTSLAYIIGPITAGYLATLVGDQTAIAAIGAVLTVCSIFFMLIVPRKIHLPQTQINHI